MAAKSLGKIDRHKFHGTRDRGYEYRLAADGTIASRWGYIPGLGRKRLDSIGYREGLAEWRDKCGRVSKGEKVAPANVRFREVAESWYEGTYRLAPWTRKLYRASLDNELLPRFGHLKLGQIDADMVAGFVRKLDERGLSTSTIQNYLLPFSGTFDLAIRRSLVNANPYRLLLKSDKPKRRQRAKAYEWSQAEIDSLLDAAAQLARQPESRYDYTPLLRVAVDTGLRLGELLGLQWGDIDLAGRELIVRRQWTRSGELADPKTDTGLDRQVALTDETVAFLREHRLASRHSQDGDFVFASRKGGPLGHRNVQRRGFEAARDLAELPTTLTFHDLRHAFVSRCAARGVPLDYVADMVGHANSAFTSKVYKHLFDRHAQADAFRTAMSSAATR